MRPRLVAFLSLFGLSIGLLAPSPATAEEPTDSRVLVFSSPDRVRVAKRTVLAAQATEGSTPLVGQQVRFEKRTSDGSWQPLASATTGTAGNATHALSTPLGAATYRAVLPGTSDQGAVVSAPRTVTGYRAPSLITMSADHWFVTDESSLMLRVLFTSGGAPVRGRVTLQQRTSTTQPWRQVAAATTGTAGRISFRIRPRVDTWFRVVGQAGQWWLPSRPVVRLVDNRPIIKPVAYPAKAPRPRPLVPNPRATTAGPHAVITRIPDGVWRSMVGRSWHRGCPVGRAGLRLIRVNYWGYDGYRYRGEMVVRATIAGKTARALSDMYRGRYPIRRMHRVDRFGWSKRLGGANDYASMAAGNTSAFNCRGVVGNPKVRSPHSYGRAVDINTWENPYLSRDGLVPNSWWHWHSHPLVAWRSSSHPVMKIWRRNGFRWTYGNNDAHHYDGRMLPPQWATMVG